MIIYCDKCGVSTTAKTKAKKFCSQKCADSFRYIPRPKKGFFDKCKECKKDIYIKRCKMIYKIHFCSRECLLAYQKRNAYRFPCKICNGEIRTQPAQIKLRARSTCSLKCRAILARRRAEERRIKYGYTKHQLDRLARYSPEAEKWRKLVFERDNYTCTFCKERGGYIEADHVKPWAYFPELRFDINNGRTLCRKCHDKTKISAKRMKEIYALQRH